MKDSSPAVKLGEVFFAKNSQVFINEFFKRGDQYYILADSRLLDDSYDLSLSELIQRLIDTCYKKPAAILTLADGFSTILQETDAFSSFLLLKSETSAHIFLSPEFDADDALILAEKINAEDRVYTQYTGIIN